MDSARPVVGTAAPRFQLHDRRQRAITLEAFDGQPLVLAFLDAWPVAENDETLAAIRAELRGLGAALIIVAANGVWCFRPDDELQRCAAREDLDEERLAALCRRYEARHGALSLFLVDGNRTLRFARTIPSSAASSMATLLSALSAAGRALVSTSPGSVTLSRRELVVTTLLSAFALALTEACREKEPSGPTPLGATQRIPDSSEEMDVTLNVNGTSRPLRIEPRVSLLDALRERLGLEGTKKGCDHGQCGACTVLVDGRRVNACLTLAVMAQGAKITTIEGLANGDTLHPMQAAFISEDGFQCGYCTPGQIMSAVALLAEGRAQTDDEVREQMSGNICRCGAYTKIVSAIQLARRGART